eukprot:PITA_10892
MDNFILDTGFSRCYSNNIVYTKKVGKPIIILAIYVDDIILIGSDPNLINHVQSSLKNQFEMIELANLHYFLSLQVLQSKEGIFLSQSKYACDFLRHFHMEYCKPAPSPFHSRAKISVTYTSLKFDATLYRHLVGKLFYLTHTHPDLSFVVRLISGFMKNQHESHWKASKRIICYVRGYVFILASGLITWAYKKKSDISLSSIEVEYSGVIEACKEVLWLRLILSEFGFQQQHPITLWCHNQSAIQLCKDPVQHQCIKHIELHMNFIRKLIHDHVLIVQYCSIDDQVVDIFTKALTKVKFTKLQFMVGVEEVVTKGG